MVWFDGCPLYLLRTISDPMAPKCIIPRWVGHTCRTFSTSSIQVEYQGMMRGINIVYQTRVQYTAQINSHKWWHRLLLFILDTLLENAYLLYKAYVVSRRSRQKPFSCAQFHYEVAIWFITPAIVLERTRSTFNCIDKRIHEPLLAGLTC